MKSLLCSTDRGTNRLCALLGVQAGLQAPDQGVPVPGLPLQLPVAQNQLHESFLFLDRHLVQNVL